MPQEKEIERSFRASLRCRSRLGVLALDDEGTSTELLDTEFIEADPEISPDGRWLAYQCDRTGQFEIYVRPFPLKVKAVSRRT